MNHGDRKSRRLRNGSWAFALAVALVLLAGASPASAAGIIVKDHVVVNSDQVLLGDVCSSPLPDHIAKTFLSKAPSLEARGKLSGGFVAARFRQAAGPDLVVQVPKSIIVERATQHIPWTQVSSAVETYVREKAGKDADTKIRTAGEDIVAPVGDVKIEVSAGDAFVPSGRQIIPVTISVGEEFRKTVQVDTFTDEPQTVLVAKHSIGRGRTISKDDLETKTLSARRVRGQAVTDSDHAVGRIAKNAIAPGEVLQKHAIKTAPLVKRGDVVTLVAQTPSISITAFAVVQSEAETGEMVELKNLDTGVMVRARIQDAHTAIVELK